jgi:hypothetical protein
MDLQSRKKYTDEQLFIMQHPIYRSVGVFFFHFSPAHSLPSS